MSHSFFGSNETDVWKMARLKALLQVCGRRCVALHFVVVALLEDIHAKCGLSPRECGTIVGLHLYTRRMKEHLPFSYVQSIDELSRLLQDVTKSAGFERGSEMCWGILGALLDHVDARGYVHDVNVLAGQAQKLLFLAERKQQWRDYCAFAVVMGASSSTAFWSAFLSSSVRTSVLFSKNWSSAEALIASFEGGNPLFSACVARDFRRPAGKGRERDGDLLGLGEDLLVHVGDFLSMGDMWSQRCSWEGSSDLIFDCCFTKASIVSCSGAISKVWDPTNGKLKHVLAGHGGPVAHISSSPRGNHVLSAASDGALMLWNTESGVLQQTFLGHEDTIACGCFFPCEKRIISGSDDGTLKVWCVTGNVLHTVEVQFDENADMADGDGEDFPIRYVQVSPDGIFFLVALGDHTVQLFCAESYHHQRTFKGHTGAVNSGQFSASSEHMLSASDDSSMQLWDVSTGRSLRTFVGHTGGVGNAHFSFDGRWILSVGNGGTLILWGVKNGEMLHIFDERPALPGRPAGVSSCSFALDGKSICAGHEDGYLVVWGTKYLGRK
jgi:WD40 repeat protein